SELLKVRLPVAMANRQQWATWPGSKCPRRKKGGADEEDDRWPAGDAVGMADRERCRGAVELSGPPDPDGDCVSARRSLRHRRAAGGAPAGRRARQDSASRRE